MESLVWTDAHEDGAFANYYQKTAGDLVQSFWCRSHLEHMGQCFQTNPVARARTLITADSTTHL
eukprot:9746082-Alexandrium_andersonii.AAC.1